jgi:MFS family permease
VPFLVTLPGDGVVATGVLGGVTLGTGALVAPYQRRLGSWTAVAGSAAGAVGFALAAVAAGTGVTALLLPAALLLGAGSGWSLAAGLALTGRLAPEGRRGALTGVFYTTAYLGFAAPFVVTSVAARTGPVLRCSWPRSPWRHSRCGSRVRRGPGGSDYAGRRGTSQ